MVARPPDVRDFGSAAVESAAMELGLALDAEQVSTLVRFMSMLQRWNTTYNLTAVRDPAQMLTQHLFDSLAVVGPLRRRLALQNGIAKRLLDVGSGGGLPGAVLAVVEPELTVVCVDSVGKKAAFITQVASELGLANLFAIHSRVEALKVLPFDVVVCRAYASLPDFVKSSRALLAKAGVWMAMKAKVPADEIAALPAGVEVFHVEPLVVPGLAADRCLVWMRPLL